MAATGCPGIELSEVGHRAAGKKYARMQIYLFNSNQTQLSVVQLTQKTACLKINSCSARAIANCKRIESGHLSGRRWEGGGVYTGLL